MPLSKDARKEWDALNKERRNAYKKGNALSRKGRDPVRYVLAQCVADAKLRAENNGLTFEISVEALLPEARTSHDRFAFDLSGGVSKPQSMSLDRFDNSKGYTLDNTRVIPFWMNRAKGSLTLKQVEDLIEYVRG